MKLILIFISPILLFLSGCGPRTLSYKDPETVSYEIVEKTEVTDSKEVEEAIKVIKKNLKSAENEDMEAYRSTIIKSAHGDTTEELEKFFEDYDLEHTVLGVTVLEQEEDTMLLQVTQQSIATDVAEGAEEYKDHIAVANHTLLKEDGQWKIAETTMTDNYFIE